MKFIKKKYESNVNNKSFLYLYQVAIMISLIVLTFQTIDFSNNYNQKNIFKTNNFKDISAIIFSSSIGYYNYRQTANAMTVYHILKSNNLLDSQITLAIPQNTGCCQKNPLFGTISFLDQQYTNINTQIEIDKTFSTLNLQTVVNMFRNKYKKYTLNKLKRQKSKRLFIYLTGHGGDYYFKIRQRQAILQDHFRLIFNQLQNQKMYESILLFIDSCSASTPFQSVQAKNFIALASSSFDQKSLSHGFDKQLNAAKSDDFSYYLTEYLKQNPISDRSTTIKQLHKYMDHDKLRVNSKIITAGFSQNQKINNYMQKDTKYNKRNFIL